MTTSILLHGCGTLADLHIIHHRGKFVNPHFYNFFVSIGAGYARSDTVSMGELAFIQIRVKTLLFQKLGMAALLHNMAVPHHQDQIRFLNRR